MIQLDLSEKADYIAAVFKVKNRMKTKQAAIIEILERYSEVD